MIVCSCRAVSDRALREAATAGLSHHEVVAVTGAGTDCGCCSETVAEIVAESHGPCCAEPCSGRPRRGAA